MVLPLNEIVLRFYKKRLISNELDGTEDVLIPGHSLSEIVSLSLDSAGRSTEPLEVYGQPAALCKDGELGTGPLVEDAFGVESH